MGSKIVLACENCKSRNYTTHANKQTHSDRMEMKKFCKTCNRHTLHLETK
ncbi:50S ribosomal protein L33 [Halalkalibacterium ligniniphilum]|nr:50S ribosomal protein L33 [Halalkalibacterium ligniniphilum]